MLPSLTFGGLKSRFRLLRVAELTQNGFFDQLAGFGKRCGHGGAEVFAYLGRAGANDQLQRLAGQGIVKLAAQREQFGCAEVMGVVFRATGGWFNGRHMERTGFGFDRAIDKQDGLSAGNVFSQFRSPLMVSDDAHAGLCGEALLSPFGKPKSDAVISAQRVAAGKNEASG